MSFQDLEAGHVRGAPLGSGGRRNGRGGTAAAAGAGASQAVASGVFQINTAVATFQRLVNTLGTPKDTPDLRDRMCVRRNPRLPLTAPPPPTRICGLALEFDRFRYRGLGRAALLSIRVRSRLRFLLLLLMRRCLPQRVA
jgi:hypothetical protein